MESGQTIFRATMPHRKFQILSSVKILKMNACLVIMIRTDAGKKNQWKGKKILIYYIFIKVFGYAHFCPSWT